MAALIGVSLGVAMGASKDFTLSPVHAHLNLLGWVSMVLYGLFYRAFPRAAQSKLAVAHFVLAVGGLAVLTPALALELMGYHQAGPVLGIGSVVAGLGFVVFAALVWRHTGLLREAAAA